MAVEDAIVLAKCLRDFPNVERAFVAYERVCAATVAGDGVAGLTQRILALEVLAWFAAMGWLAFRRP